jgi:biotin carboxylase
MIKKRILILNGSHSDIPLIKAAKKLGFYVITTGNMPNLIGHQYADVTYKVDFFLKDKILKLAKKLRIDAICSCANDFGAITASYVAEKMKLQGHDSYKISKIIHEKDKFKRVALKNNLPVPNGKSFSKAEAAISSIKILKKVIIKPVDMTGGKGVSVAERWADIEQGIKNAFAASKCKRIIIEDFIDGSLHSFSTFLKNKKVIFYYSDNEYLAKDSYSVTTSFGPATNINDSKNTLINFVEKISHKLDLVDGIFHCQYIFDGKNPWIIDVTRRCSGDLYPYPVNLRHNFFWEDVIIRSSAGLLAGRLSKLESPGFFGRHCVMAYQNGKIKSLRISDALKEFVVEEIILIPRGQFVKNYNIDKIAILILHFKSLKIAELIIGNLDNYIKVEFN